MEALDNLYPLVKISDISLLNQFLHECVDDLLGKKKTGTDNYNSSSIEWTKEESNTTKKNVQHFLRQSVINNTFELDSSLPDKCKSALKNCYDVRKNEIFQSQAKECIINSGHNLVENFDWKLKWILGSSDLATIREPLLQVHLHCTNTEKNTVNFEATLEQVDYLMAELTKVSKELN